VNGAIEGEGDDITGTAARTSGVSDGRGEAVFCAAELFPEEVAFFFFFGLAPFAGDFFPVAFFFGVAVASASLPDLGVLVGLAVGFGVGEAAFFFFGFGVGVGDSSDAVDRAFRNCARFSSSVNCA
jgi:hypothetical protein